MRLNDSPNLPSTLAAKSNSLDAPPQAPTSRIHVHTPQAQLCVSIELQAQTNVQTRNHTLVLAVFVGVACFHLAIVIHKFFHDGIP